jgi:hypothetical protein
MDYIFDWARDIYREAIIGELRTLSASNNSSLGNDSDIFSIVDRVAFWPQGEDAEADTGSHEAEDENTNGIEDALRVFDSPDGVLRTARYIRSRLMALYLTEDNLSLLVQSMKSPEKAKEAARTILRCLKDSWLVSAEALNGIELMWTGKDRESANLYSPDKTFHVVVTLAAYLSPSWEQTRELCYLAVSQDIIEALFAHAALKSKKRWDPSDSPCVQKDDFVGNFETFRGAAIEDNLVAAISRACLSTKLYAENAKDRAMPDAMWATAAESSSNAVKYRFDAAITADRHAHAREFVSSIYNLHKIGRNEPSISILRISTRLDDQGRNPHPIESLWPPLPGLGNLAQKRWFFIVSKNPSNLSRYAELCLFVKDEFAILEIHEADPILEPSLQWQFQARRLDSKPGWGRGWNNAEIKVQDDNFPNMFTLFGNHLRKSALFSEYNEKHGSDDQHSDGVWKPKKSGADFELSTLEPLGFLEIMHHRDMETERGRHVTSIINRYPPQSRNQNSDKRPTSRKGKDVDRVTPLSQIAASSTQDIGSLKPTSRTRNASKDTPRVIGWVRRSVKIPGNDVISPVSPNSESKVSKMAQESDRLKKVNATTYDRLSFPKNHLHSPNEAGQALSVRDPATALTSNLIKRSYSGQGIEEEEGEPSSRNSKRSRTDPREEFARDYLGQDELAQLISEGYFG